MIYILDDEKRPISRYNFQGLHACTVHPTTGEYHSFAHCRQGRDARHVPSWDFNETHPYVIRHREHWGEHFGRSFHSLPMVLVNLIVYMIGQKQYLDTLSTASSTGDSDGRDGEGGA